jgi:ATP-binding cassette subfamily B protein RaxB
VAKRRRNNFLIFDPQLGWHWTSQKKLARQCTNLGIQVECSGSLRGRYRRREKRLVGVTSRVLLSLPRVKSAIALFASAQLLSLALPLLSMWSVDSIAHKFSLRAAGIVAIGFVSLSIINIVFALLSDLVQSDLRRRAAIATSNHTFDLLESKSPYWFEINSPASLQHRLASLNAQLEYYVDSLRICGGVAVTLLAGIVVLLFVSPWLALPGFGFLALSIAIDLLFHGPQRNRVSAMIEANRRRQAFVLDTLAQLPLFVRHGSAKRAKFRLTSLVRRSSAAESRHQTVRGWRAALGLLSKSAETLLFLSMSTAFMSAGQYTIGGFVALAAYKDLLAGAISEGFQLLMRGRALKVHMLQTAALYEKPHEELRAIGHLVEGRVLFEGVSFAYGSLEREVLSDIDFELTPGTCTVIRGASGSGKSTIAKLIVGVVTPTRGHIALDGAPVARNMNGMAAVLQSDRLIYGSVRDNITLYRKGISDEEVLSALRLAAIDDFVLSLPMRLNTAVGESVVGLSGGQRQRLLLARAIVQKPKLLVLDEATSSLDVPTEAAILRSLRDLGTTILLIAHRPEVWEWADTVLELENGRMRSCKVERITSLSSAVIPLAAGVQPSP